MEMDFYAILEYQSQVYPFLLIDHADEVIPGKSAKGYKYLNMNDYFFKYHFPGDPIMPGVLLVEAIGQVATLALVTMPELKTKNNYLTKIKNADFFLAVRPGNILYIETEILKYYKGVAHINGICKIKDEIACKAEITVVIPDIISQFKVKMNKGVRLCCLKTKTQ